MIVGFVLFIAPLHGRVLLEDDFSGDTIDATKWSVVDYSGGTVVIENGAAKISGRGHLNTAAKFNLASDPDLSHGIIVSGQWMFTSNTDFFQLLTRSDGIPSSSYGETQTGMEMIYNYPNNTLSYTQRSSGATGTDYFRSLHATTPILNEYYNFSLVDSGGSTGNVYFVMSSLDGTQTWEYQYHYTGALDKEENYVTFHNREGSGRVAYLDNVRIETKNYVSDDFDGSSINRAQWTTLTPKNGTASVSDGSLKLTQRSYLNTFQHFNPAAEGESAPLTITCDWSMNDVGDFIQILTRSDATVAGSYGETNTGIEFYLDSEGGVHIQTRSDGNATVLVSSENSLTKRTGAYAITITDNGSELTFDIYQKSNPSNRATITTTSDYRLNATDGQFVALHNREISGYVATIDNLNIYYATSDFSETGSLQWTGNGLAATAYRQNAEGTVINTVSAGTEGVAPANAGWKLYAGTKADGSDAVFVTGDNGMLGSASSTEVINRFNHDLSFESGALEFSPWSVVNEGRAGDSVIRNSAFSADSTPRTGAYLLSPGGTSADTGQTGVGIVRSVEFQLSDNGGAIGFHLLGGTGGVESIVGLTSEELIASGVASGGFNGVALRIVESDEYVLSARRTSNSTTSWEAGSFSAEDLLDLYTADPDAWYTLDLIDATEGGWGWVAFDDISNPYLLDDLTLDQNKYHFLYADGVLVATANPIPEPGTFVLLLVGFAGICFWRRKRRAA